MDGTGKGDFSRLEERPGLEMKGGLGMEQREAAGTRMALRELSRQTGPRQPLREPPVLGIYFKKTYLGKYKKLISRYLN